MSRTFAMMWDCYGLEAQDLAFEEAPQRMVDTVRGQGTQIYSARDTSRERVIE